MNVDRRPYIVGASAVVLMGALLSLARDWLDRVRERGLDSRFTLPTRSAEKLTDLRRPSPWPTALFLQYPNRGGQSQVLVSEDEAW